MLCSLRYRDFALDRQVSYGDCTDLEFSIMRLPPTHVSLVFAFGLTRSGRGDSRTGRSPDLGALQGRQVQWIVRYNMRYLIVQCA
jgi:hypothetical protein